MGRAYQAPTRTMQIIVKAATQAIVAGTVNQPGVIFAS